MAIADDRDTTRDAEARADGGRPPRPVVAYRDGWQGRIPEELRARRQWVVWAYEWRDPRPPAGDRPARPGKWTKVLYQPEAPVSRAKADTPRTWSSFDRAARTFGREPEIFSGVGFVFSPDDPYCGFDLDACLGFGDDGRRVVLPWAADALALFDGTYREISPSGTGIKGVVRADLGDRKGSNARGLGDGAGAIELYDRGRFFAITGDAWGEGDGAAAILDAQGAADALYEHIRAIRSARDAARRGEKARARGARGGRPAAGGNGHPLLGRAPEGDEDLLRLARSAANGAEFSALYDRGDASGHESDSEADGALCCHLAFWTQKDAARMERLWLASGLGGRGKVRDRPDYRAMTIATAIEKTQAVYRPAPAPPMPAVAAQAAGRADAADQIPWTDRGLAERLVRQFGHLFRYCVPWRRWLVWDGCRWAVDDTLAMDRYLKATVRRMQVEEAATIPDPEAREAFLRWAMGCESKRSHEAALRLAMGEEGIPILPGQLDADPWLLNCRNGTIDLKAGRLRPHRREDLISKVCPVDFDPGADAPLWDSILRRFLVEDDLVAWMDRMLGYAITGVIRQHVLPVCYGTGANGKSTILNAMLDVLGDDYGMKAPPDLLLARGGEHHPTERASLFGKRLVVAIETEDGRRFNESIVKELTGGDRITARRMREDFWSFAPTHKILLATNHRPGVKGGDNGIWRRLRLIHFGVSLPLAEQDPTIPDRLRDEFPGILARCVRNCLVWQQSGFPDVEQIEVATREYREEEDVLGEFIADRCVTGCEAGQVRASDLYGVFRMWCESNGYSALSSKRFGKAIQDRGFEKGQSNGRVYRGINLRRDGVEEGGAGYELDGQTY